MIKAKKILSIIGLIFSVLIIGVAILSLIFKDIEIFKVINDVLITTGDYDNAGYSSILIMIASFCIILLNLLLKKSNKALIITCIVLSVLTYNVFSAIASILALIIKIQENRAIEEERIKNQVIIKETITKDDNDNEKIVREIIPVEVNNQKPIEKPKREKKPVIYTEVKTSDIVLSVIGIIFGLAFICGYALLIWIYQEEIQAFLMPDASDFGMALFIMIIPLIIYIFLIFIVVALPLLFIIANIILTIFMLTIKRKTITRITLILGFITLSIFNSIAAIRILKRYKTKELNKENENNI